MIPRPAVLASIPIFQILHKMPSYFLREDVQILDGNPLDQVAWDYAGDKPSYRRFCQHMSKLFFSRPAEVQLRDCTAGAVRLAVAFLRPFFHSVVLDDFDVAISYLRTFALTISQWPGQSWANDHPEVRKVIESVVLALGEELREKYRHQQQEEICRLQDIIDGLQYAARTQGPQTVPDNVEVDSDGDSENEFEESDEPTLVNIIPPSVKKRPSLEMSIAVLPRMPVSFQTPITPPDSPRRPSFLPTVVVPINMPTSIPKIVLHSQDGDEDRDISSRTPPEHSDEPSLPSPSRSFVPPVFSRPSAAYLAAKSEASTSVSSDRDEDKLQEHATSQVSVVEQQPSVELEAQDNEDENESLPDSPQAGPSTLSSRRSSIVSNDTLCETSEFPYKRFSSASSDGDSKFDSVPALTIEIPSRSSSFSDTRSITPELGDFVVQAPSKTDPSIIPLPPSPSSYVASDSIPSSSLSSPITPKLPIADLQLTSSEVISPKSRIGLIGPLPTTQDDEVDEDSPQTTRVIETASYIVTGFLVGAFMTLFLFSTQRRTLLYLT